MRFPWLLASLPLRVECRNCFSHCGKTQGIAYNHLDVESSESDDWSWRVALFVHLVLSAEGEEVVFVVERFLAAWLNEKGTIEELPCRVG